MRIDIHHAKPITGGFGLRICDAEQEGKDGARAAMIQVARMGQEPTVWATLYKEERDHLVQVAATAARMGIEEKQIQLAKDQGMFQIACKKYTQAGDRVRAMKVLLKSGDTERITYFAGTARQPEIYVLAANYLQSLDWHAKPELTKQILSFYSKAKDFRKMATFYEAIAQVEIDEYRDYEKAANCLKDALKVLQKAQMEFEYAGGD